ncbi:ABC transporter permease [Haloarchaeobius sp. HRN-SO-5]|uniref:ABC transporter permease n=1 Tax=Haloarchaeobius sp. HRN-SO-5 TaxID=3446118 RepID=UPI003EBFD7C6
MTMARRVRSEFFAAWHSFLRRRVAVFFTFFFPVLLVGIFGALVQTNPAGGGLFAEDPAYYVPGYLAVVVLQTPLSRMGSEVARHREGHRFEKLATTPLSRAEWLMAHTLVNTVIIAIAGFVLLALTVVLTGADVVFSPLLLLFVPVGVVCFCGVGSLLGAFADSQDGAITAANAIGLPLLFLSETFVPPSMLPEWFHPIVALSPLTYFAQGLRQAIWPGAESGTVVLGLGAVESLAVLSVLALGFFAFGTRAIPRTD